MSEESLKKFKEIYHKEYGIVLSDKETLDKASKLLNLYRAVYLEKVTDKMKDKPKKSRNYSETKEKAKIERNCVK